MVRSLLGSQLPGGNHGRAPCPAFQVPAPVRSTGCSTRPSTTPWCTTAPTSSRAQADERSLTRAFTAHGREGQWRNAPDYLLRSLPGHARAAGLLDSLLTDGAYLLRADLRRLLQVAEGASSPAARRGPAAAPDPPGHHRGACRPGRAFQRHRGA